MIQMSNAYHELSATIGEARPAILSLTIPELPFPALRHSHSIVSFHDNALNFQRKFFRRTLKHRPPDPSEICALEFKGEFRRFGACSVSATIGIDWSIFLKFIEHAAGTRHLENTVSLFDDKFGAPQIPSVQATVEVIGDRKAACP